MRLQRIEPEYATRTSRVLVQGVDAIIAGAPTLAALLLASVLDTESKTLTVVGALLSSWYYFFADGFEGGQSLGKRWAGLRVVDAETGAPCTFGQSLIRNVLLMFLGPLDWLFIFGDRHQRLGDKAAGTIVIDADP